MTLAKEANDILAAAIQRHGKRLEGFAHLPMQDPFEAANELEQAVRELGFRGALKRRSKPVTQPT